MKEVSLKRGMLVNSLGSLVGLGCQWLITIAVVRMADGFDAAGSYSLAMSVYGIFGPIGRVPCGPVLQKEILRLSCMRSTKLGKAERAVQPAIRPKSTAAISLDSGCVLTSN